MRNGLNPKNAFFDPQNPGQNPVPTAASGASPCCVPGCVKDGLLVELTVGAAAVFEFTYLVYGTPLATWFGAA